MILNHLHVALRTLRKKPLYTAINVIGLTLGVAAALLIFRIVNFELSFNKSFENYERIVRVSSRTVKTDGGESFTVCVPIPAMDAMEQSVSQFEKLARVREVWGALIIPDPNGGPPLKKFATEPIETAFFAETAFVEIFDFDWLAGEPSTALDQPGSIVLTRSWAEKCFDDWRQAMGQTVLLDNLMPLTVTGVMADLPPNVDFNFPFLIDYETLKNNPDYYFYDPDTWGNCSSNNQVYALLNDEDQLDETDAVLAAIGSGEYSKRTGEQTKFHYLQPLSDIHYNEILNNSGTHRIAKSRIRVLGAIGLLILIMACFNFINLATAQASLRAKEVGVRKTLGGRQEQLVGQFMLETGLIVVFAVAVGVILATSLLPLLNKVSNVPNELPFLSQPEVWAFLLATTVVVTLLSGLYPSLSLAAYPPVQALRNDSGHRKTGGIFLRKSLVVLQFVIAQALIIGAIITLLQLDYIRSRDLGFSNDLVYTFPFNSDSTTVARQQALKQRLLSIPTVNSVSLSSDQPMSGNTWNTSFRYGSRPEQEDFPLSLKFSDSDYHTTYGIELLAGNWFAPSDTVRDGVINETLVRRLSLNDPNEAIGQYIEMWRDKKVRIVGVVEDFHTHSLRRERQPLMITSRKEFLWEAGIKIRPGDIPGTIAAIESAFDEVLPEQVFAGRFLDENIAAFYEDDNRLATTCKAFGLLAIIISCLGLFGLATHAAAQRVKEIGIRKVLGASVLGIVNLLSKDFLKIVLIALLIAAPLTWWLMGKWLEDFVYRIDIPWWVFVVAGGMALIIAFITVSYQSIRAALANPVHSLRSE